MYCEIIFEVLKIAVNHFGDSLKFILVFYRPPLCYSLLNIKAFYSPTNKVKLN